ncbi:MAG: arginine repressor [Planctomycetota bacterium]
MKRLDTIREVIKKNNVSNQEEFVRVLRGYGIRISQASLSRDLKDIGAQRIRKADGSFSYELPADAEEVTTLSELELKFSISAKGIRRSGFVVLVFTPPGEGPMVGKIIDKLALDGFVGSVAGDDTIICIAENEKAAKALEKKLKRMTG